MNLLTQTGMHDDITVIDVVDSTMTIGRDMLKQGVSRPFGIVSNQQRAGYGKKGRFFFSPRGAGVYQTYVFDIGWEFDAGLLTTGVAVSVAEVLFEMTGIQVSLKWVNDFYLHDRKMGGVLVEGILNSGKITQVIIGIGLNILPTAVPSDLEDIVTTLGVDVDRNALVAAIFERIVQNISGYQAGQHLDYYRQHSYLKDKMVTLLTNNQEISGQVLDIGTRGELLLKHDENLTPFISGDVTNVFIKGKK